jgi:hypothetical protein
MNDLAKRKLHGPVATLKSETATWDANRQDWQPARFFTVTTFRRDGVISTSDTHNPDGSIAHSRWLYDSTGRLTESDSWLNDQAPRRVLYSYDDAGRHIRTVQVRDDGTQTELETCTYDPNGKGTKTRLLPVSPQAEREGGAVSLGYSIEDTDMMLGGPGAAFMTTAYAAEGQPAKVLLEDQNHHAIREVDFERDASGRLLNVETRMGDSEMKDLADRMSPEARERATAVLKEIFGKSFSRTTYKYDPQGRLIERTDSMGTMSEEHKTYRYDGVHEEAIEEIIERKSREASVEDDGAIRYNPDTVSTQHTRFDYSYDTHGNWTERIVSVQYDAHAESQRSNTERRTIAYLSAD